MMMEKKPNSTKTLLLVLIPVAVAFLLVVTLVGVLVVNALTTPQSVWMYTFNEDGTYEAIPYGEETDTYSFSVGYDLDWTMEEILEGMENSEWSDAFEAIE